MRRLIYSQIIVAICLLLNGCSTALPTVPSRPVGDVIVSVNRDSMVTLSVNWGGAPEGLILIGGTSHTFPHIYQDVPVTVTASNASGTQTKVFDAYTVTREARFILE